MKALVTGATGFIGSNLVRQLMEQGYRVRALVRRGSDQRNLAGLDIEVAFGDLTDRISLDKALDGCEALFHVAASYALWTLHPEMVYETNVKGTENILAAALKPVVLVVPLTTDGCVDTEVDEDRAMKVITLGCSLKPSKGKT